MMIAYWVVSGFFIAFGWHYGDKVITTYIDKPETAMEQKSETKATSTKKEND
jgi:hypothetical protein